MFKHKKWAKRDFLSYYYTIGTNDRFIQKTDRPNDKLVPLFVSRKHAIEWAKAFVVQCGNGVVFEKKYLISNECVGYFPTNNYDESGDVLRKDGIQVQCKADTGHIKADNVDNCDIYAIENSDASGYYEITKNDFFRNVELLQDKGIVKFRTPKQHNLGNFNTWQLLIPKYLKANGKNRQAHNLLIECGATFTLYPPDLQRGIGRNSKPKYKQAYAG